MAKKTKDTGATATKAKAKGPADPAKARNLARLLNILALLLAITAFLLQLFAVLTHHWKWQITDLRSLISPNYHYSQPNLQEDSRLDQTYGLYSRDVKLYANNDEQMDAWASTRFPRVDDGEENFHHCLSQTSTLRGAFLTCSNRVVSPEQCHCRRYPYWKFVIFFEVTALILLGLVVFLIALLPTQYQASLKLAAAGLAILAFLFLLFGIILIRSHLKRETRSLADAYPHINQRLADKLGAPYNQNRGTTYDQSRGVNYDQNRGAGYDQTRAVQRTRSPLRQAVRRQASNVYRAYSLSTGQHAYNDTHFQEYSEQERAWVYRPYSSIVQSAAYAPRNQQRQDTYVASSRRNATAAPAYNSYGPTLGYDQVFDHTRAGLGWSSVLSILSTILSLLIPLLLLFSWMTAKKAGPETKTVTTTSVKTEYVPLTQNVHHETTPTRQIYNDYNPQRPMGDAIVTTQHASSESSPTKQIYTDYNPQRTAGDTTVTGSNTRQDPLIVRDVVIRDDQPGSQTTTSAHRAHTTTTNADSSQSTHHS